MTIMGVDMADKVIALLRDDLMNTYSKYILIGGVLWFSPVGSDYMTRSRFDDFDDLKKTWGSEVITDHKKIVSILMMEELMR